MRVSGLVALVVLGLAASNGSAQEVKWRHDYAAARKEAAATGKPLLLDFGTEACTWCKKLDATTFRNPAVVQLLNERFIPVKVDAEREARLTEAVKVDSFPTLLVVAADGKIVGRHVGYADVAQANDLLAKAPAPQKVAAPPASNPAAEALARARAEHDAGNYLASIERCEQLAAAFPGTPEAAAARELAKRITADPAKWTRVTGQVETDLAALRNAIRP